MVSDAKKKKAASKKAGNKVRIVTACCSETLRQIRQRFGFHSY